MQSKPFRLLGTVMYWAGVVVVLLVSAEVMARLHDWLLYGESMTSTPTLERNLRQLFADGTRGTPLGSYHCCQLNSLGFRGVELERSPKPEQVRIAFLGASEIFGSCAVDGSEIPARVAVRLKDNAEFEVVNTAVVGMTVASLNNYWTTWVSQIRPTAALIYANPLFELNLPDRRPDDSVAPRRSRPAAQMQMPASAPSTCNSRFLDALKNRFTFPNWIQEWRNMNAVANIVSLHREGWAFDEVPGERVDQFIKSLEALTESTQKSGVMPVLITHAIAAKATNNTEDLRILRHGRTFCPRAPEQVLVDYSDAVNEEIRQLARRENLPIIDLAAEFDGRREFFVDLVHFNAQGEEAVSRLVAQFLVDQFSNQQPAN